MAEERMFSDGEYKQIVKAFLATRPATEAEICEVVRQVEIMRLNGTLVEMVFAGELLLDLKDGELAFQTK